MTDFKSIRSRVISLVMTGVMMLSGTATSVGVLISSPASITATALTGGVMAVVVQVLRQVVMGNGRYGTTSRSIEFTLLPPR